MSSNRIAQIIPLCQAVFCVVCENVSDSSNDHCEKCGSSGTGLIHLKRILDEKPFVSKAVSE